MRVSFIADMKILYLCSWYRTDPSGFSGIFFAEQAAVFANEGHDVALASCSRLSIKKLRMPRRCYVARDEVLTSTKKAPVYRGEILSIPDSAGLVQTWAMARFYSTFLNEVLLDYGKPDVVHIQSALNAGIHSFRFLQSKQVPYVITEHASAYRRGLVPEGHRTLVHRCYAGAASAMAVSRALREDLVAFGVTATIDVVPNIYDRQLFRLSRANKGPFAFLIVCALNKNKGVHLAIEAMAKIKRAHPNARLHIVGEGPERDRLEQLVITAGLNETIEFHGYQERESVAAFMQESHCVVSTSYVETFGVSLVEGLATGRPVIATRSGGPQDFVKEPYGYLVAAGDSAELARAMQKVITNYEHEESVFTERHAYAKQHFSDKAFYQAVLPMYERAALGTKDRA